jgi:hypothetical protein
LPVRLTTAYNQRHDRRRDMSFYWLAAAYVFEVIVALGFVAWVKINN